METMVKKLQFEAYHVLPDSPQMQRDFLYIAASLAAHSREASSGEILRIAKLNAILPVEVQGFQEFKDKGLGGLVTIPNEPRPRAVVMGTRDYIQECGLEIPAILEATAQKWEQEPGAYILVAGWDGWARGVLKFKRS